MFGIVSLVLAALAGAQPADPKPAPAGAPAAHLLVVPETADAVVALARTDARIVARYAAFSLVEAVGEDDRTLRAAGAHRRDDMRYVSTAAGRIDPRNERATLAGKAAPDRAEVLALVQFVGPPKHVWLERLRATGARVVGYSAQNAYVVHALDEAVDRVAALAGGEPFVRAVVALGASDKVEPGAASGPVAVQTVSGARGEEARERAETLGPALAAPAQVAAVDTRMLRLEGAEVAELARDPAVLLVEPYVEPELHDERQSQIAAGKLSGGAPTGPGYLAWLSALGFSMAPFDFTIDVTDQGLDNGSAAAPDHPDFYVNGVKPGTDRVTYASDYTGDASPAARDCGGHGTNVASIAAGYNAGSAAGTTDGAGFAHGLGVAPQAPIGASKIFSCVGDYAFDPGVATPLETVVSSAYLNGARISNNSWGFSGGFAVLGSYTVHSQLYDRLVRDARSSQPDNQEMVQVFSAGNNGDGVPDPFNEGYGSVSPPATAKNVITVGASEGVRSIGAGPDFCQVPDASADRAGDLVGFSSRGPTDDERRKPELVAPGSHALGARPIHGDYAGFGTCNSVFPSGTLYSLASGTSQAAPVVAGAAALIRDWYRREHGGGTITPSPAMTKAILVDAATEVAGGNDGKGGTLPGAPSNDTGWGRVNLGAVFEGSAREYVDQADVLDGSGDSTLRSYAVADPSRPVRVTLAWTDAVPATAGGDAFVNDLDLEVSTGAGNYLGNVMAGGASRLGGVPDTRNNIESVVLPAGLERFSVLVDGATIGGDGVLNSGDVLDQDYALVVSNAVEQSAPMLAHDSTTVDDPGLGGDGDGVLESGEQFSLEEQVRNDGTATASDLQATLGAAPASGLTVTQPTAAYSDVAAGATDTNDVPFQAQLAGAASCGLPAAATLSIETDEPATHTVPIVLDTGEPGSSQQNAASSAAAIPDDSSTGVSSSVFVAERGRIKDVDVAVNIAHTWVGDLTIDLIGPDGTTVRLADHVGGPDNATPDFPGTVFDDEAAQSIATAPAPYTGTYRPQSDQLSRLYGKSRRGTWTLRVRDLFEGDTGVLSSWSATTQKALCDFDTAAPDTTVASGPPNATTSNAATFTLAASESAATFECRLDGGAFDPCGASQSYTGLALGAHTFAARAIDGSDNEDPTPATYAWTVTATAEPPVTPPPPPVTPPRPAASFVLAPADERLADALAGSYRVLAACASACRTSAWLSVSARTARKLKLGRRPVTVASASASRRSAGTATAKVRLTRRARRALRGRDAVKAKLRVTVVEGASRLTLARTVRLLRAGGLRRVARRGVRLWAACARQCPLSAELTISAREARRIGVKRGSASRIPLASGRTTGGPTPQLLKLRVRRTVRGALHRARRVGAVLEAVAGTAPDPTRTARLSKTLRR